MRGPGRDWKTKLVHAKIAYDKGDYEFGLSLLEKGKAEHLDQIRVGGGDQASRFSRCKGSCAT